MSDSLDPRTRYHIEKAKSAQRHLAEAAEAKRIIEAYDAREAIRRKGGRPRKAQGPGITVGRGKPRDA